MKMLLVVLPTRLGGNQIYYLGLFGPSGETVETLQSRMFVFTTSEKFIFVSSPDAQVKNLSGTIIQTCSGSLQPLFLKLEKPDKEPQTTSEIKTALTKFFNVKQSQQL